MMSSRTGFVTTDGKSVLGLVGSVERVWCNSADPEAIDCVQLAGGVLMMAFEPCCIWFCVFPCRVSRGS